jgi:protein subunit release factor A
VLQSQCASIQYCVFDALAAAMQERMSDPAVASDPDKFQIVAKQASKLEGIVDKYDDYKSTTEALHDTRAMLKESEEDEEMAEMVRAEIEELEEKVAVRSLRGCVHSQLACTSRQHVHRDAAARCLATVQ